MIFYAKTGKGVLDFVNFFAEKSDGVLWIRYGVLSEDECDLLRQRGFNVNQFMRPSPLPEDEEIACNLDTIADHHPEEPIWIER
jgi:hypothetical protein